MAKDGHIPLFSDANYQLSLGGKRKSTISMDDVCTSEKRNRLKSSSTPPSTPPSGWELKRSKMDDLIAAKNQIIKLESALSNQHAIRKEMEILFEKVIAHLMEQQKKDEQARLEMRGRLEMIKRSEQEFQPDNPEYKKLKDSTAYWNIKKEAVLKQISDLKNMLFERAVSRHVHMAEMKRNMNVLLEALEDSQTEVKILTSELAKQTRKAALSTTLGTQLDEQTFELQGITNKFKEMEYERELSKGGFA